jgi:hypothetical protein
MYCFALSKSSRPGSSDRNSAVEKAPLRVAAPVVLVDHDRG